MRSQTADRAVPPVRGVRHRRGRPVPGLGFFVAPGPVWDPWEQDRHALIEAKNFDSMERPRKAFGQL
jgi:hypothetical protein